MSELPDYSPGKKNASMIEDLTNEEIENDVVRLVMKRFGADIKAQKSFFTQ
jgi:hypothetical protein